MKRFSFHLSIALIMFFSGTWITFIYQFLTQIPEIKVQEDSVFACPLFMEAEVEIIYNWQEIKQTKKKGKFQITNRSQQSIYYLAYEETQHFDNFTRQNGKLKMATDFICHMGMDLQELKPNESRVFEINVPHNKKPFEAGFEFFVGSEKERKTFWVTVNEKSNYDSQIK